VRNPRNCRRNPDQRHLRRGLESMRHPIQLPVSFHSGVDNLDNPASAGQSTWHPLCVHKSCRTHSVLHDNPHGPVNPERTPEIISAFIPQASAESAAFCHSSPPHVIHDGHAETIPTLSISYQRKLNANTPHIFTLRKDFLQP